MNHDLFYQSQVIDNNDPLMLGRIRARRLTDNYDDIIKSITDPAWDESKDAWTKRDPFIYLPLLPYYLYQVPKVDEMVLIMYNNPGDRFVNQFYIQSTFFSPTSTNFQYYQGGNKFMGTGIQISEPKPLKNKDGTYTDKEVHKGVFPEPGDNSLLGRGSADVIVKENDVLIRAGKFKSDQLKSNVVPVANQQRGFLQLSKFNATKEPLPNRNVIELITDTVLVNYLIEYMIINPENTQDKFTGSVYLYKLKPDVSVNSENLTVNSHIDEKLKTVVNVLNFSAISKNETIQLINNYIKTCNDTNKTNSGDVLFIDNNNKFPIFYRPSPQNYKLLGLQSASIEQKNLTEIYQNVKLNPSIKGGYGLIYTKNKVGKPTRFKTTEVKESKFIPQSSTFASLGSDTIVLLSHKSSIPNKGKINFDDTLYGITPEKLADEIIPKTSSMIRGEELIELLNLIVRFLITHTHAYPGLPPVSVTQDGTNVSDILSEIQNAANKILNTNIRIN